MLGVRAPDRSRAILVVTVDGELAVAVRDVVPPEWPSFATLGPMTPPRSRPPAFPGRGWSSAALYQ
jgi:hypothetical protein